jgi:tetratricopeptide (TPR) repeat protein
MIRSQRNLAEVQQQESLTQTEKLLLRYEETREWVRNNQRLLSGVAVVFVAIIVGLWWWAGQRKTNNERAATYTNRAMMAYYMSADYRHAIDGDQAHKVSGEPLYGLRYIVREYGSTPSATVAALALGNCYYYLGKYDSARIAFEAAPSSEEPVLQASIDAGRAAILERGSNKTEAAKLFEKAAGRDKTNPFNAEYLIDAARAHAEAKEKDDAIRVYQKILEDYPNSQYDDAAKRELLKMNVEL